ncbi:MAG: ThiF family adenylyltransferase [Pseudomonadota bacterium]
MTEIVISEVRHTELKTKLKGDTERFAALYLNHDRANDRFLVSSFDIASESDCVSASETAITITPEFLMRVTRKAKETRTHLALLHTHLFGYKRFSSIDDDVEQALNHVVRLRLPESTVFAMVLCDDSLITRRFSTHEEIPVRIVGRNVHIPGENSINDDELKRFDRQVRAFGSYGQSVLQKMKVAIVGVGGTGSILVQQLAHLGIRDFVLIDPDVVESSNLNRVVGTSADSIGRQKVEVSAELIRRITPNPRIVMLADSVIGIEAKNLLTSADCVFSCTDSHSSRAFISELAYAYLVPTFDIGVAISADKGEIKSITGRCQMLAPGLPCLLCSNAIDGRAVREELMTPEESKADPYFRGDGVRQPAVISLNSTMVSLAVTMFLSVFTGVPATSRWSTYDAMRGVVRSLGGSPNADCPFCGSDEACAAGDTWRLSFIR